MSDVGAIHGRVEVASNSVEDIREAVVALLETTLGAPPAAGQVMSVLLASSPGLDAAFPAQAAREWGLGDACLLGIQGLPQGDGRAVVEALIHLRRSAGASPAAQG